MILQIILLKVFFSYTHFMIKILAFLWKYLQKEKKLLTFVTIPMLIAFVVGPLIPLNYKNFIDLIAGNEPTREITQSLWYVA